MPETEKLEYLAALGWTDNEIAGFLGQTPSEFDRTMQEGGDIYRAVSSGRLRKRAEIEIEVARKAAGGDLAALKEFKEIVRDKSFSISKLDLFGGSEKEGAFQRIQDYIATGSKGTLSSKEQVYIDILTLIYSLDGQYGKRRTIKFLTSPPFSFDYNHASDMYAEAVELFFSNRKVSKEALRAKMADQFDALYVAARDAAASSKDYALAAGILENKAKALKLDKEEPAALPPEIYTRPFRLLSLTPESIGLPAVNRQELGKQIDSLVAPETVRRRLKIEAGISDMNLEDVLENGTQEDS